MLRLALYVAVLIVQNGQEEVIPIIGVDVATDDGVSTSVKSKNMVIR